jgi:transposase
MVSYSKISYHDNFLSGKKCVFCGSFKVCRTKRGYIKCNKWKRQKGSHLLRRELKIIRGFYQQQPAYRLASDLGVNYQTVTRVYQKLREAIYHVSELESGKLRGEIELDEAYFGGRRKGKRGRGAAGKSIVFGLLERNGRVYTKVVDSVSAHELMEHIIQHTKKGSV